MPSTIHDFCFYTISWLVTEPCLHNFEHKDNNYRFRAFNLNLYRAKKNPDSVVLAHSQHQNMQRFKLWLHNVKFNAKNESRDRGCAIVVHISLLLWSEEICSRSCCVILYKVRFHNSVMKHFRRVCTPIQECQVYLVPLSIHHWTDIISA